MRILAISSPTAAATAEALAADMDAEIAQGVAFYEQGLIVQAYMDTGYEQTFMLVEAESVEAVAEQFARFPQVAAGLIAFAYTPLVGLPAIAQVHEGRGEPMPEWWPADR